MKIQAICPVCKGDDIEYMYSIDSEIATQFFVDRSKNESKFQRIQSNIEKLWGDKNCSFLLCSNCSFIFAFPYLAGDEELYSLIYDKEKAYPKTKWEYKNTFEILEKKAEHENLNNAKLLEIGAGNGAFIKMVSPNLLKKINVLSTEYSGTGQTAIEKYDIKCLSKDIREPYFQKYQGYFDIVCAFQVLEHLDNLHDFFCRIDQITKDNADIFLSVPNYYMRTFLDKLYCYIDIPPIHIGRWNQNCLSHITNHFGWEIEDYKIEPQRYHLKVIRLIKLIYPRTRMFTCIKTIRIPILRKICHILGVALLAVFYVPSMLKLRSDKYGLSQWIYIKKHKVS